MCFKPSPRAMILPVPKDVSACTPPRGPTHGAAPPHVGTPPALPPRSNYHRATTALVELRQCCCHPHIVRKEAVGPGGRGGGGGKAAGERLSMRQIMAKLVAEAYAVYDQVRQAGMCDGSCTGYGAFGSCHQFVGVSCGTAGCACVVQRQRARQHFNTAP